MRRMALAAAGLLVLAGAALSAPARAGDPSVAGALGRSLGGLRIAVVNALFLRAEALRARGRVEEATSLYATILELDPGNEAAFDHLAAVYAYDVLPEAITADDRLGWWREAWDVAQRGLALRPRSGRLLVRSFDLLWFASREEDLAAPVADAVRGDPALLAFDRLLDAARETEEVPRKGRAHLLWLALWTPQLAAERLVEGDDDGRRHLVRIGREALRLRGERLAAMRLPPEVARSDRDLAAYLREGLDAVEAVAASRGRSPEEARAAVRRYAEAWAESPLVERLEESLR